MQLRNPGEGCADFDRNKAAGKASMEALRCLERRLSDIVYRQLRSTPSGSQERVREDTRYDKDDQRCSWVADSRFGPSQAHLHKRGTHGKVLADSSGSSSTRSRQPGAIMSDPSQRNASLKDEHALMMRAVTPRAQAVASVADENRWPQPELRELLKYLHLEVLRQLVDEEWLLFRVQRHDQDQLARLRSDHLALRLAVEALDQAAATEGTGAAWSPRQLAAATRDLLSQLAQHLAAEDDLAILGDVAPATASLGAQPHEWYALTEGPVVDLDELPGELGADAALARLLRLKTREQVEIQASFDPSPLWQRLIASDPGGYGVTYLQRGPGYWRVEITRHPPHSTPQPYA
jgi:uncharacterized protein (DUF2249 family)/hemerythrin-like domain-containing protein